MGADAFQGDHASDQRRSLFGGSQGVAFDIVSRLSQEFCHLSRVRGDHHLASLSFQCFQCARIQVNAAASSTKGASLPLSIALASVMQADGIENTPEAQDHVAPALSARRPVVKLAEETAKTRLICMPLLDAQAC